MTTESENKLNTYIVTLHDKTWSGVNADFYDSSEAGFSFIVEENNIIEPVAYYSRDSVESIVKQTPILAKKPSHSSIKEFSEKKYFYDENGDPLKYGVMRFNGKSITLDDKGGSFFFPNENQPIQILDSKGIFIMSWSVPDGS